MYDYDKNYDGTWGARHLRKIDALLKDLYGAWLETMDVAYEHKVLFGVEKRSAR